MNKKSIILGIILGLTIIGFSFLNSSLYILQEWEQAIITQFGKPVEAVTEAGLHFKIPFIRKIRRMDKRILNWDGDPNRIPTKDKKYIHVDTTARWRIMDPLLLLQTVQSENGALARLDSILDSVTRDTISNHNLVEAVRNTNAILDKVKARQEKAKKGELVAGEEEEVTGEIEPVSMGREKLSAIIIERAAKELKQFGIELIDVQLRRIAYEESVEVKVYERMISERKRIAQKIRSIGLGKKAEISGKISRDLQGIESAAYRKEQEIKGAAEAIATKIYGRAMNADPVFYEFLRKLEACKKAIPADTKLILSTDSEFLKILQKK